MSHLLLQIVLLLGTAVTVVVLFHRLHIPTSLGYLLVGLLLGPYTLGPVVDTQPIQTLAEFGIVFLLFTIGLNFSLSRIQTEKNQVFVLGTGQVVLTTSVVTGLAWLAGLPLAAAFVIGAVFAQSSTTVITRQLIEQREDNTPHGRLATSMSVFQDVTAVPFVVLIPALSLAAGAGAVAGSLALALAKAAIAFVVVFLVGRWLLRPLFHFIAERRSAEIFTLTVLLVSLAAAWFGYELGLSMAFGAFLAGMMLGETEFRHQVESAIRPFRDVLLGLFFIGIGMLFDPLSMLGVWPWVLLGTVVLMGTKVLLVAQLARGYGLEPQIAWRTGFLLAVGGEFGFALLSLAFGADVLGERAGQIALGSVLLSMVIAPFLIRYNQRLTLFLAPPIFDANGDEQVPTVTREAVGSPKGHVIICGYGRIGQSVGHLLEEERIPYIALDLDPTKVAQAHLAGEPVFYGDASESSILEQIGVDSARLVVISHGDIEASITILRNVRDMRPDLPVMVRTHDETHVDELKAAGASEIVPETLGAGLIIVTQALLWMKVPRLRILERIRDLQESSYRLLRETFVGGGRPTRICRNTKETASVPCL